MLVIPFSDSPQTYKVFVVLEEDGIARIKDHDPAQVPLPIRGFENKRLELVFIGYADTADMALINDRIQAGDVRRILDCLSRGFEFRPDLGDHDGPMKSLKP